MSDSRRLLVVHAHPDDECMTTGGILAKYAAEGTHVCLVCCTNGELGEIAEMPGLVPDDVKPRLAQVRLEELAEACATLGVEDVRTLGYHDSGMAGMPENDLPEAFINQDLDEPAARIAEIIRHVRPQVAVTYNEFGFYGHPDHIRAHLATLRAIAQAADPEAALAGEPWKVQKRYYTAIPMSALRAVAEHAGEEVVDTDAIDSIGTPDELVTTTIDCSPYIDRKVRALEAHRTQFGTTRVFLEMPNRELILGTEFFVLVEPPSPGLQESDLFQGVS
jgi:N-acetyl-1-D-myo-inositol-2-amino-2-deoxy-alpha-D-glucopyranoside deacetylase